MVALFCLYFVGLRPSSFSTYFPMMSPQIDRVAQFLLEQDRLRSGMGMMDTWNEPLSTVATVRR